MRVATTIWHAGGAVLGTTLHVALLVAAFAVTVARCDDGWMALVVVMACDWFASRRVDEDE